MTDIHLLDEVTRACERTFPAEVTATLTGAGGMQLFFSASIEATANSWEAALVEFTSGDCEGMTYVVAQSNIQSLIVSSPFYNRKPQAGDTVRIYGGPLSELRVFQEDPETIKGAVDDGVKYFMTGSVLAGGVAWRGLGGRATKGVEAIERVYGVELSVETKHVTGLPTEEDMYRQFTALPLLKEQIVLIMQTFRVDAQNRITGEGNIEWTKGFIQRPGNETMRAYVINFDVVVG